MGNRRAASHARHQKAMLAISLKLADMSDCSHRSIETIEVTSHPHTKVSAEKLRSA